MNYSLRADHIDIDYKVTNAMYRLGLLNADGLPTRNIEGLASQFAKAIEVSVTTADSPLYINGKRSRGYINLDAVLIVLDPEVTQPAEKEFVIAHELGHLLVHRYEFVARALPYREFPAQTPFKIALGGVDEVEGINVIEREANSAAGAILVPWSIALIYLEQVKAKRRNTPQYPFPNMPPVQAGPLTLHGAAASLARDINIPEVTAYNRLFWVAERIKMPVEYVLALHG